MILQNFSNEDQPQDPEICHWAFVMSSHRENQNKHSSTKAGRQGDGRTQKLTFLLLLLLLLIALSCHLLHFNHVLIAYVIEPLVSLLNHPSKLSYSYRVML